MSRLIAFVALPLWSVLTLVRQLDRVDLRRMVTETRFTASESIVVANLLVLTAWLVLVRVVLSANRGHQGLLDRVNEATGLARRPLAWLSASLVLAPTSNVPANAQRVEATIPIGAVMSPAIASGVLAHILRRRREQSATGDTLRSPDHLTDDEMEVLARVRRVAIEWDSSRAITGDVVGLACETNHEIRELLDGVERVRPPAGELSPTVREQWQVVVRVFGYPLVESPDGSTAEFRKRRSLELLTWLALNRDRQRRSAARTAMWDIDVSDATFSTIVSDMRRALTELDLGSSGAKWCPHTYSDELPLAPTIVTDAELLEGSLRGFSEGTVDIDVVVRHLSGIRDVPFAGTAYTWADLDGTTTRLVILAMEAATTVAHWALEHGRRDVLTAAVGAGLRVMPGCEELLALQEGIVNETPVRRSLSTRC